MTYLSEILEVLAGLFELGFDLLHFLAVKVDVEQGNAPDAHLEQALDVRLRQVAHHLLAKRLEPLVNRRHDRLVGFALLDFLVNAFFDEDAFQGAEMELVLELGFFESRVRA